MTAERWVLCLAVWGACSRVPNLLLHVRAWPAQDITPSWISINGHPCSIQINITLSNMVPGDDAGDGKPLSAEHRKGNATVEGVEQAAVPTVSAPRCSLPTKRLLHAAPQDLCDRCT